MHIIIGILSFSLCITSVFGVFVPDDQERCPCVTPLNSRKCMNYDPRYMATSLDEAMYSFPNLVQHDGTPLFGTEPTEEVATNQISILNVQSAPAPPIANARTVQPQSCNSPECLECKLSIVNGFLQNSNSSDDVLLKTREQLKGQVASPSVSCDRFKNSRQRRAAKNNQKAKQPKKKANQILRILNTTVDRAKRQDMNVTDELLGITSQIGCDYKKGTALSNDNKWCGLCNLCWQWRRLPEDYFPNYINEVSCDVNDNSCLAGFGACRPVIRVLNILKRVGPKQNAKWEPITIESAAACECQVEVGTALHSLAQR